MPADAPVLGFVLWRNAKTDPPRPGSWRITDQGWLTYESRYYDGDTGQMVPAPAPALWCGYDESFGVFPWHEQPSVYAGLQDPPVAGPHGTLTLADLRLVCDLAGARAASIADAGAVARVRAALAAEKGETT